MQSSQQTTGLSIGGYLKEKEEKARTESEMEGGWKQSVNRLVLVVNLTIDPLDGTTLDDQSTQR